MISKPIRFFASPWSAPAWMKTNGNMSGRGFLIGKPGGKHYKTWANYFVRFIKEYALEGIHIEAVTVQNEPTDGFYPGFSFQGMCDKDEKYLNNSTLLPQL